MDDNKSFEEILKETDQFLRMQDAVKRLDRAISVADYHRTLNARCPCLETQESLQIALDREEEASLNVDRLLKDFEQSV